MKNDLDEHVSKAKEERIIHDEKEQAYIKSMKVMENEKAVLSAAVEARTSKLKKMDELKEDFLTAQKELSSGKIVRKKLVRQHLNNWYRIKIYLFHLHCIMAHGVNLTFWFIYCFI